MDEFIDYLQCDDDSPHSEQAALETISHSATDTGISRAPQPTTMIISDPLANAVHTDSIFKLFDGMSPDFDAIPINSPQFHSSSPLQYLLKYEGNNEVETSLNGARDTIGRVSTPSPSGGIPTAAIHGRGAETREPKGGVWQGSPSPNVYPPRQPASPSGSPLLNEDATLDLDYVMASRSYSEGPNAPASSSPVAPHEGDGKGNEEPVHTTLRLADPRKPQCSEGVNVVESTKNAKPTLKLRLKVLAPRRSGREKRRAMAPSSIRFGVLNQPGSSGHSQAERGADTPTVTSLHVPTTRNLTKVKERRMHATGATDPSDVAVTDRHGESGGSPTSLKRNRKSAVEDVEDAKSQDDDDDDDATRSRLSKTKKRCLRDGITRPRVGRPTSRLSRNTVSGKRASSVKAELEWHGEPGEHGEVSFSRRADQLRAEISRHHSKLWCAFCPWRADVDNRGWPKGTWSRVQDSPGRHMKNCKHLVASKYYRRKLSTKKYNTHAKVVAAAVKEDRKVAVAVQCPNDEAYMNRLSRVGLEHADILRALERRAVLYKMSHCRCCLYPHWSEFRSEP
ncbi:hypothetical protein C8Q78DRAFT_1145599 [Trametes maxima]|nr:hypothetical protein C8Q78DRAFT_1145599 [Trametes maxima]